MLNLKKLEYQCLFRLAGACNHTHHMPKLAGGRFIVRVVGVIQDTLQIL